MRGATTEKIREWAMELPEVTEKQHHLFKTPAWQVHGRSFVGISRDESTAVFLISEECANNLQPAVDKLGERDGPSDHVPRAARFTSH